MHRFSNHSTVVVLAFVLTCSFVPVAQASASGSDSLQALKAATARYHSLTQAIGAGYWPGPTPDSPGECVSSPEGAMGYHFENQALMTDGVLRADQPEILLYERKTNGKYSLTGVEYYVEADQTAVTPVLFGQAFQGPMPPHHPGQEVHYDLHAWVWTDNPSGTFAQWNPDVTCP